MKSPPLVSIITPTYKRLKHLKKALECVKNQTYKNWEHLVIADGHDEKVENLIKKINDPRIRYLYTKRTNFWGNAQRKLGLNRARGSLILFFDDDNLLENNYLEEMVKAFDSPEIGFVYCQIRHFSHIFPRSIILKPQLPFWFGIDSLNFMARKSVINAVGGWPQKYYAADNILARRISKISKGKIINKVLGCHQRVEKFPRGVLRKCFEWMLLPFLCR